MRLLTRFVPYIFEDPDWRGFFWSTVPGQDVCIVLCFVVAVNLNVDLKVASIFSGITWSPLPVVLLKALYL